MRLSAEHLARIRDAAGRTLGDGVDLWLFGSRTDDSTRGGDIDLYVELDGTPAETIEREMKFYAALQRELGEQRIDLVVHRRRTPLRPFDREARTHGVRL